MICTAWLNILFNKISSFPVFLPKVSVQNLYRSSVNKILWVNQLAFAVSLSIYTTNTTTRTLSIGICRKVLLTFHYKFIKVLANVEEIEFVLELTFTPNCKMVNFLNFFNFIVKATFEGIDHWSSLFCVYRQISYLTNEIISWIFLVILEKC